MRKIIYITFLVALFCHGTYAQDDTQPKNKDFNFGGRFGTSIYSFKSESLNSEFTGLYGALFIEKPLSSKWSVQLEINYTGLDLLSFPLLLNYNISNKFEIYGGGEINYSLSQSNTEKQFRNKRFGMSLILGAKYNINTNWFLDARYTHGLTNQFPIIQFESNPTLWEKTNAHFWCRL